MVTKGWLMLVFHAHLPFVRHPELDYSLEENWLFEAITETYVPLIMVFERLRSEGIDFCLTMSITPTLMSMLTDGFLQNRYHRYLLRSLELADKEKIRTWGHPYFHSLARLYRARLHEVEEIVFSRYCGNILSAFRDFQNTGHLEIITSAATHGFLPLLQADPRAVKAQIKVGVETYEENFGCSPRGIWLPECAYYQGLEDVLAQFNLRFFFLDTAGLNHAEPPTPFGVFAPLLLPNGIAAFGRDEETSRQVWCAETGYPGDPVYRDFYRDLGFDLDLSYIGPYIDPAGNRIFTGFKYYRISQKKEEKEPYEYSVALEKAKEHAGHFLQTVQERCRHLGEGMGRAPVIVSAYDAELLGHWWFEGPQWLEFLLRAINQQEEIKLVLPTTYLEENKEHPCGLPAASSWGSGGYYSPWINGTNDWIYPRLYEASACMGMLVERYPHAEGLLYRALNQALRELLLAQSSDWAFIMNNRTAVEYARRRTLGHLENFQRLFELLHNPKPECEEWEIELNKLVSDLEWRNNLFPHIDYRSFS